MQQAGEMRSRPTVDMYANAYRTQPTHVPILPAMANPLLYHRLAGITTHPPAEVMRLAGQRPSARQGGGP